MGRFINADALVSTGQGILGNNMFAYCGNNPASCADPTGKVWCDASPDAISLFDSNYILMSGGYGSYAAVLAYYSSDNTEDSGCHEEREKTMFGGTRYTRILPWEYSMLDFSNEGITIIDASMALVNVTFEWDFLDLRITPFDAFSANFSAGLNNEEGLHASALVYMLKPSASINLFGFDVTAFAYIGAIGGEFAFNPLKGIKVGVAPHGFGGGISISWDY